MILIFIFAHLIFENMMIFHSHVISIIVVLVRKFLM